eukprot:408582_1
MSEGLIVWDSPIIKTIALAASGGLTEAITGHPLDSIKVRLQTHATKDIFRHLYRGILPPLLSSPTAWVLNFALYQRALGLFKSDALWNVFFSGGCAGIAWSVIICPFEMVKCNAQRYRMSSRSALTHIRSQLGYIGLYRGFTSCLIRDIPVSSVYFCILEGCRRYIPNYGESKFVYPFLTGSLCGIGAWITGLPGDCIKSQIQTNFVDEATKMKFDKTESKALEHSHRFIPNFKQTIKHNGLFGLYRGILPVVSRSVLTTGCCIVVIEYVNRTLFLTNTW